MKDPVGNIKVSLYTLPKKNEQVDKQPKIPVWLKEFVNVSDKKLAK